MPELRDLYHEFILDHSKRPHNFCVPEAANCSADGYDPLCGDRLTLYLRVEDGVIGGRIYDAHIAALAQAAKARTVVTQNLRHFRSLERHGIRVLTAEHYAAARGW